MLSALRGRKAKKVTAWVLVILVGIPFIFYFGWTPVDSSGRVVSRPVTEINGHVIYENELPAHRINLALDIDTRFFGGLDYQQLVSFLPDDWVISQTIQSELLAQRAMDEGFDLSPAARREALRLFALRRAGYPPAVQMNNQQLQSLLIQLASAYGLRSMEQMEDLVVRRELRDRGARLLIYPQARTSILELWQAYEERNTTYSLVCALFRISDHVDGVEVTDADVEEFYDANLDQFSSGPRRVYEHVTVSRSDLEMETTVTDEEVSAEYAENIGEFSRPDVYVLSQIVLEATEEDEEVPPSVQSLIARVATGESFDALASELRDAGEAAGESGPIGRRELSMLDPKAAEAISATPAGEITPPLHIQTGDEYHWIIYRVGDVIAGGIATFREASAELRQTMAQSRTTALFDQSMDDFRAVFEDSTDLEEMATQLNLEIQVSEPVLPDSLVIPGVGALDSRWRQDLQTLDVGGLLAEVIQTPDAVSIVRLAEERSRIVQPLDDGLSQTIRRRLVQIRGQEIAEEHAYRLRQVVVGEIDRDSERFFTTAAEDADIDTDVVFEEIAPESFQPLSDEIEQIGPIPGLARTLYYSKTGHVSDVLEVRNAGGTQSAGYVIYLVRDRNAPDRQDFYEELPPLRAEILADNQDRLLSEWFADATEPGANEIVRHDLSLP
jgi:peptidyl-prolyl cis-trans isomerase D